MKRGTPRPASHLFLAGLTAVLAIAMLAPVVLADDYAGCRDAALAERAACSESPCQVEAATNYLTCLRAAGGEAGRVQALDEGGPIHLSDAGWRSADLAVELGMSLPEYFVVEVWNGYEHDVQGSTHRLSGTLELEHSPGSWLLLLLDPGDSVHTLSHPMVPGRRSLRLRLAGTDADDDGFIQVFVRPERPEFDYDALYRPGSLGVLPPHRVAGTPPRLPSTVLGQGQGTFVGTAWLGATVSKDGTLTDVEVLRELPAASLLGGFAKRGVEDWRYEPCTRDGVPVACRITVRVTMKR